MQGMKKFYDVVYKVVMVICKILLIADILITSFAIVGRYIDFLPDPTWSEEIVLTLMSYMAVLSAALAIRRKAHIRMTSFDKYLSPKLIQVLDLLADVAVFALAVVMLVVGWNYANTVGARGFYPSIPGLSKRYMYYPIPLAGLVMIIFECEQIVDDIRVLMGKEASA